MPPAFDKLQQEEADRSFTSWKLDLLDAMSIDPRLKPFDFLVGFTMLQFMNGKTGLVFPSIETLAVLLNKDPRHVRRSIGNLIDAGWVNARRPNRQKSNRYEFDTRNVNAMLDRRTSLEDAIREMRRKPEGTQMSSQRLSEGTQMSSPEGTQMSSEHLKRNTSRLSGIEQQDSQYGTGEVNEDAA